MRVNRCGLVITEKQLQELVRELAGYLRLLCYHTHDSRRSEPGFPDLVIVGPNGVLFRELKSARGVLTTDQEQWLSALGAACQNADVWRPGDWPDRIRRELEVVARTTVAHEVTR